MPKQKERRRTGEIYIDDYDQSFRLKKTPIEELLYQWAYEEDNSLEYTLKDGFHQGDTEIVIRYAAIELKFFPEDVDDICAAIEIAEKLGIITRKESNRMIDKSTDKKFLFKRYSAKHNDKETE